MNDWPEVTYILPRNIETNCVHYLSEPFPSYAFSYGTWTDENIYSLDAGVRYIPYIRKDVADAEINRLKSLLDAVTRRYNELERKP